MSDTDTTPAQTEAKPEKAPKVDPTKPCLCSTFEVVGKTEDEIFSTGCEATTKRQFAQGHDARLVSFLVDGYFDGYTLRQVVNGVSTTYATPSDAAKVASENLQAKAAKATANRQVKLDEKDAKSAAREKAKSDKADAKIKADAEKAAAKEAAKADKAAKPQAEVVAGSAEGDGTPLAEGQVKIKVGRWEYNATVDADGTASYVDGKGEPTTIERDGYRLLDANATV